MKAAFLTIGFFLSSFGAVTQASYDGPVVTSGPAVMNKIQALSAGKKQYPECSVEIAFPTKDSALFTIVSTPNGQRYSASCLLKSSDPALKEVKNPDGLMFINVELSNGVGQGCAISFDQDLTGIASWSADGKTTNQLLCLHQGAP